MSVDKDVCLQCGKTRQETRDYWNSPCATATGYEVIETLDEWERHHWRDWSDKELAAHGVHPSLWEENRRTNIYDLEWPVRSSHCLVNGHKYPKPWHPPLSRDLMGWFPENLCMCCYEEKLEEGVKP